MPSANAALAMVALVAYLSAALLPCERDVDVFASVSTAVGTHAMPTAETGMASLPRASHHAAHEMAHGMKGHSNHGAHHVAHAGRGAETAHRRVALKSALVWMPKCLCGCGDTRATVGGGAARLGPAVPSTESSPWPTEVVRTATMPAPRPIPAPDNLIDPIPT